MKSTLARRIFGAAMAAFAACGCSRGECQDGATSTSSTDIPTEHMIISATGASNDDGSATIRATVTTDCPSEHVVMTGDDQLIFNQPGGDQLPLALSGDTYVASDGPGRARDPILLLRRGNVKTAAGWTSQLIVAHALYPTFDIVQVDMASASQVRATLRGPFFGTHFDRSDLPTNLPPVKVDITSTNGCASLAGGSSVIRADVTTPSMDHATYMPYGTVNADVAFDWSQGDTCDLTMRIEGLLHMPFWRDTEKVARGGLDIDVTRTTKVTVKKPSS